MTIDIEELLRLRAAATLGEWTSPATYREKQSTYCIIGDDGGAMRPFVTEGPVCREDAELICAVVNALPELASRIMETDILRRIAEAAKITEPFIEQRWDHWGPPIWELRESLQALEDFRSRKVKP